MSSPFPNHNIFSNRVFWVWPLVFKLNVPISRSAEGPSGLTSIVISFGSPTSSATLFHIAPMCASHAPSRSRAEVRSHQQCKARQRQQNHPCQKNSIHFELATSTSAFLRQCRQARSSHSCD